jgi:hypothetical protein
MRCLTGHRNLNRIATYSMESIDEGEGSFSEEPSNSGPDNMSSSEEQSEGNRPAEKFAGDDDENAEGSDGSGINDTVEGGDVNLERDIAVVRDDDDEKGSQALTAKESW